MMYNLLSLYCRHYFGPCLDPGWFLKNWFLGMISKNWFLNKKMGWPVWSLVSQNWNLVFST
jgi:hypothetical protein